MSVPHLDTRYIDGKPALLFGPFAGFTTRFLKTGSLLDLLRSVRPDNLPNLLQVAGTQWPLTRYLIKEALSTRASRLSHLDDFVPNANHGEWSLRRAGQRVQIIKTGPQGRGTLEFGTEVLTSGDGSLAALLGASPGASTCVSAMLTVIERCLPELTKGYHGQLLQSLIPSYGHSLKRDAHLLRNVRDFTHPTLGLMAPLSSSLSTRSECHADWNTQRDHGRRESGRDHTGRRAGVA
jgi:malate dehydrogenase (quinone)